MSWSGNELSECFRLSTAVKLGKASECVLSLKNRESCYATVYFSSKVIGPHRGGVSLASSPGTINTCSYHPSSRDSTHPFVVLSQSTC
jgi:hypothetical protein